VLPDATLAFLKEGKAQTRAAKRAVPKGGQERAGA